MADPDETRLRRGRGDIRDPETLERSRRAMALGFTIELAARYIGISRRTWSLWRKRGNEGDKWYREWLDAVEAGESECAETCLAMIRDAAITQRDWKAAAWLMERRFGYTKPPHVVIQERKEETHQELAAQAAQRMEELGVDE